MSTQQQLASTSRDSSPPAGSPAGLTRRALGSELRFALAETAAGGSKLVMLVGESGSGKTQQAQQLLPHVRQRGGMLIESRIESLNWSNPLDSLLLGLSQLSQPLTRQLSNPGLSGQEALLDLVRRLRLSEQVTGDIDLSQALHLQLLVGELLSYACQQLRPLVWIIDDVDLLDQDALAVIDYLIEHRATPYLMLLLCVENEHLPVVQRWQSHERCQVFRLAPFSVRDTVAWLIEEQGINPRLAAEIAPHLQQTCQGNLQLCRFLLDSLAAYDLLTPVQDDQWPQRLQQISLQLRTPEAEAFFESKLRALPETCLEILQSASLIGLEFDARLLHDYLPLSAVQEHLELAQQQGMVEAQSGDIWRFIHPHLMRLAQHTFEFLTEAELHARLALRMLNYPNFALQALRHAQQAGGLFDRDEKNRFAQQSLQIAAQVLLQGSPLHAGQILEQLMALLGEGVWREQPALGEQLAELWCSTWQEPGQLIDVIALRRNVPLGASKRVDYLLAATQLRLALLAHDYPSAFSAAEQALDALGVPMALDDGIGELFSQGVQWLWRRYIRPVRQQLSDHAAVNQAQEILTDLLGPCFFSRPKLLPAIALKQLSLTMKHGACPASAAAMICGAMLLAALHRYEQAFALAERAQQMSQSLTGDRQRHRVPIFDLGFIQPWHTNLQQLLPDLWRWQQNAQAQGDFEYAAYGSLFYLGHSILNGSPLLHLEKEALKIEEDLRYTRQQHLQPMAAVFRQFVYGLVRSNDAQPWLGRSEFITPQMLEQLAARNDSLTLFMHYLCAGHGAIYCGNNDAGELLLEQAAVHLPSVRGSVIEALFHVLTLLNRCASAQPLSAWARWQLRRGIDQLKQWAQMNPILFASKLQLLQAQLAQRERRFEAAQRHYLAAIESARLYQRNHDQAIATLYYARFLLSRQQFHHARKQFRLAMSQYELWGAAGVSAYIRRTYGAFLNKKPRGI
ncbi:AAA family ATPase [Chitinibacter sp. S2-10]|uniref:AAA family ATPase n=1 Tax=Chitinibacter sp. S2-10 TaxID=3373597 RepID=UPI003977A5ED